MKIIMDMGTTNTRMYLVDGDKHIDTERLDMGASVTIKMGHDFLFENLRGALKNILERNNLKESNLENVTAFGMAGSELGIHDVARIPLPVNAKKLSESMVKLSLPQFCSCPVFVIPGVLYPSESGEALEIMRGEETEIMGLDDDIFQAENTVVLLPGTHCKSISVDKTHTITKFISGMSGEMMEVLSKHTILSAKCDIKNSNNFEEQIRGATFCKNDGMNSALLNIRTQQACTNRSVEEISSFFVGAVLYPEIENIINKNPDAVFYVGGKKVLRDLYENLLKHFGAKNVYDLDGAENLGLKGAIKISNM